MSRKTRVMVKQLMKYFLIILVAVMGLFIARILWAVPLKWQVLSVVTGGVILLVSAVFDWSSTRDLIPIFKR